MNALVIAALVGMWGAIAPSAVVEQFTSPPPRILTGDETPPGKVPYGVPAIRAAWDYTYLEQNARIEPGKQGAMRTRLHLRLANDGTYQFTYSARWSPGSTANPLGNRYADGVEVTETGKFALSGEILLLEASRTELTKRVRGTVAAPQIIESDRRAYLVRTEEARLHIAGRCAKYQAEPICADGRDVWYQLTTIGGEPARRRDSVPVPKARD